MELKKLSKREKIDLLEEGIENLIIGKCKFICSAIPGGLDSNFEPIPEILRYKPKKTFTQYCWFRSNEEGKQKRIEILKKVIEDIQNTKKKHKT